MPLVLGRRLPEDIAKALVAGLRAPGRFLTEYGLATESISSPLYTPDGYWRGPVWAPPVLLIVSGLRELGKKRSLRRSPMGSAARCGRVAAPRISML